MAIQKIELGTVPHGVGGDSYRTANEKINSNFEEVGRDIQDVLEVVQTGDFSKTAYDIAVKNGFVGSEQEWLTSLKGEQGISGPEAKSVYDIAVSNGFRGDERDWLNYILENSETVSDLFADADSLEQFINGSDSETVLTRLSAEYPTLRKAVKQMFENGGLPATPFTTKALMEASALVDGDYAMVTDDAVSGNNGLYLKYEGIWDKSKYDPTAKVAELEQSIFGDKPPEKGVYYGQSVYSISGAIESSGLSVPRVNWMRTNYIPVKKGDRVTVVTSIESDYSHPVMLFYSDTGAQNVTQVISLNGKTNGYKEYVGYAPTDGYVRAQHATTGFNGSSLGINIGYGSLADTKADINKIVKLNDFAVSGDILRSSVYKVSYADLVRIIRVNPDYEIAYVTSLSPFVAEPAVSDWNDNSNIDLTVTSDKPYVGFFIRKKGGGSIDGGVNADDLYEITANDKVVYQSELGSLSVSGESKANKLAIGKGGYSWWNEPQACQIDGIYPKTVVGAVDKEWAKLLTTQPLDDRKEDTTTAYFKPKTEFIFDEHNGAITLPTGDSLVVIQPSHNDVDYIPYYTSPDHNLNNLGKEKRIEGLRGKKSYAQAMYSPKTEKLYVFFRSNGILSWYVAVCSDWLADDPTWTTHTLLTDTEQMYVRAVMSHDGEHIRCLATKNTRFADINGLWYASINLTDNTVSDASGSVVGNINSNLKFSQISKIYSVDSGRIRLYDASTSDSKLPILVQTMLGAEEEGGYYRYLEMNLETGIIDKDTPIVESGKSLNTNWYYGGAHFSNILGGDNIIPDSVVPVYTAREDNGVWLVEEWVTNDEGETWDLSRVIDSSTTQKLWRPRVPYNTRLSNKPNIARLVWCKGSWTRYTNYDSEVWALFE